jgi:acetyl-CoA C-acetyltransferase
MPADRVCVVGSACTRFGERFADSYEDLAGEAARGALADAGVLRSAVGAAWLGTAFPDAGVWKGRSGMDLGEALGLFDVPITRVSNYCATGAEAIRAATHALLAGSCDVALAVGVEKLRDRPPAESIVGMMLHNGHPTRQKGFTAAGTFAMYARRHFEARGMTRRDLAQVSVKNHRLAIDNPLAHFRKAMSLDDILAAPMVADPIGLLDACPTTDGAAAVVLVREEDAAKYAAPVTLAGVGVAVSTGWDLPFFDPAHDFLNFRATRKAAAAAYAQAGVVDPRKDLDLAEVHDCFSIVELITYEDLGLCADGNAAALLWSGATDRGGDVVVNGSGGLLSCGHPVGATGVRMVTEVVAQLRGRGGKRQIEGARRGLAHNIGGPGAIASVLILEARP